MTHIALCGSLYSKKLIHYIQLFSRKVNIKKTISKEDIIVKNRKSSMFLALALTAVMTLTACTSTADTQVPATNGGTAPATASTASADEVYGMVVFLKGSEFFNWCYAGFQDAAASVGATTELVGPVDWNAAEQVKAIEQLVAKQVKGIAVTPSDADTVTASIDKALDSGVATICFDSDAPNSRRMTFVGTDVYNAGFEAGVAVGNQLGDSARVGISMIPGLDRVTGTINGFTDGLASVAPGAQVVEQVNDEGDVNKAEQVITSMLQAKPEINTVFCAHGVSGTGAVKATINVGRDSGDDKVHVMAYAQDVHILEMVESEELMGTIVQNPYLMGVEAFYQLWSAAHPTQFENVTYPGMGNVPTANIDTGVNVVFKGDPVIKQYMTPPTIQ